MNICTEYSCWSVLQRSLTKNLSVSYPRSRLNVSLSRFHFTFQINSYHNEIDSFFDCRIREGAFFLLPLYTVSLNYIEVPVKKLLSSTLKTSSSKLSGHYSQSQFRSTHVKDDRIAFKILDKEELSDNTINKQFTFWFFI